MPTPPRALVLLAAFACSVSLPAHTARACQIPVFRYALERWAPEPYDVVVFHEGELGPAEKQLLGQVGERAKAPANVTVTLAQPSSATLDEPLRRLWKEQSRGGAQPKLPWAVVRRTEHGAESLPPVWAGPLEASSFGRLVDSPARQQVSKKLLSGDSAVFVLIESGDAARDGAAAKVLDGKLREMEKAVKLPEINPADPGPQLLSQLPLKVAFSTVRLSQRDAAEGPFVQMLLQGLIPAELPRKAKGKAPETAPAAKPDPVAGPVLVPVYGRGRALCALPAEQIAPEQIEEIAAFLTGACSCQVKQLNPGYDLLFAANWESILGGDAGEGGEPAKGEPRRDTVPDPVIGPGRKGLKQESGAAPQR